MVWKGGTTVSRTTTGEGEVVNRRSSSLEFYYLQEETQLVSMDTIICNGVEFEPVFDQKLVWRLLTPVPYIQELACGGGVMQGLGKLVQQKPRDEKVDITSLVFHGKDDFNEFLQGFQ